MMHKLIQRVELSCNGTMSQCCPFCGHLVLDLSADPVVLSSCAHTLFVATDDGFEYRARRFEENVGIMGRTDQELAAASDWAGIDALTDRVSLPDSVKFARYEGAPSFMGAYAGFAPVED